MNAALAIAASPLADPLKVLRARADARAYLWASFDIEELHDAVDPLQTYADESGLLASIGQDAVQAIIGGAFRRVNLC